MTPYTFELHESIKLKEYKIRRLLSYEHNNFTIKPKWIANNGW